MKKCIYSIIILVSFAILFSCESTEKIGFDQSEQGVNFRMNSDAVTFNLLSPDPKVNLTMYSENKNINKVRVLIEITQNGGPTSPRSLLTEISGSAIKNDGSSKLTFSLADFAEAVGLTAADISGGDAFTIYNVVELNNGLVFPDTIITADNKQIINLGNVFSAGAPTSYTLQISFAVVCPSDLGGEYSYVTTNIQCANCAGGVPGAAACGVSVSGTGELNDQGGGIYKLTDATFGQYGCAWADTPAVGVTFLDVCDHVSFGGADQYGLVYSFTIAGNTGTTLTIDWQNDYGDSGTSALTRTDGKTWPGTLHD